MAKLFFLCLFVLALGCSKQTSYEAKTQAPGDFSPSTPTQQSPDTKANTPSGGIQQDILTGLYSGSIVLNDKSLPPVKLDISLAEADLDLPGDGQSFRRNMSGSFILDSEGGPSMFSSTTYDLDTSLIDMRYTKTQQNNQTSINNPNLRFYGARKGSKIEGSVTSSIRGTIGKFSVTRKGTGALLPQNKYVGKWKGKWKLDTGSSYDVILEINASPFTSVNPSDSEIEFTPGKIGAFKYANEDLQYPFNQVYIDYIRKTIRLSSNYGTGLQNIVLSFNGVISGDTISGDTDSSMKGHTGTFTVTKMRNP